MQKQFSKYKGYVPDSKPGRSYRGRSDSHDGSRSYGENRPNNGSGGYTPNNNGSHYGNKAGIQVGFNSNNNGANFSNKSHNGGNQNGSHGNGNQGGFRGNRFQGFQNRGNGNQPGQKSGFGFNKNFRKPMQKSRRVQGTDIEVSQLINKVNDEAIIKVPEQTIQHQFEDFKMDPRIKHNIRQKGYITPTPIQDQSIPVGLEGKDVIGLANTGTGKTAAFLIPLLNKMLDNRAQKVLILAPTRELAFQINDELREFGKGFNLNSILCIGGSNIVHQIRMLKNPFNFIIGTPGRVLDLIDRKLLKLEQFQNVVLDEADRMVDMGFIHDIRKILGKMPIERQSFMFTATLEPKVEDLIRQFMKNPVKVSVKMRNTSANIEQDIVRVPSDNRAKMNILIEYLNKPGFDKVLVFGRTKHGVEKVTKALFAAGIKADSIHGNKSQNYRQRALLKFKKGEIKTLVATDVAARGLDISAVSHVINFDIPATYEDYVHRIGRTGRADRKGIALTFVSGQ